MLEKNQKKIMESLNNWHYEIIRHNKYYEEGAVKIAFKEVEKLVKQEMFLDIIKRKFNGSVRDFLIWYGGEFKDVDLDETREVRKR